MKAVSIPSIVARSKKRLGRGHGSGKVKTAGRGTKGQKSREKIQLGFEGGQLPIIKKLPLLRGKGKNSSRKTKAVVIPIGKLSVFPKDTEITLDLLRKHHIIREDISKVKILGNGDIDRALKVSVPCSKSVRKAIEKAGGIVVV